MADAGQPGAPVQRRSRRQVAAIAIAVAVVAVGGGSALYLLSQTTAPLCPFRPEGNVIQIGFSIALTGRFNTEGGAAINGIRTAVEWVNANGGVTANGITYRLAYNCYDDQSDQSNVQPLYTRLVEQDGAQFLLAPYSSALTQAAAPFADQLDRVMLSHGGASDAIFQQGYENIVAVLSPASHYLRTAVDVVNALDEPSADKQIAILHEGDPFSSVAAGSAEAYAESLGLQVVYIQEYPSGVSAVDGQLRAARDAGADVLIGGGHYNDGLLIMSQLQQIDWTPKFVSLLVAVTEPDFRAQLENRADGVTGPSQWEAAVKYNQSLAEDLGLAWYGPTPAEFVDSYRNRFGGRSPSYHAAEAAAAVLVLAEAIRQADSLETAAVRQVLGDMTLMTFFGEYDIDQTGLQIAHDMVLIQWQAGTLKVVAPSAVAEASLIYPYTGS